MNEDEFNDEEIVETDADQNDTNDDVENLYDENSVNVDANNSDGNSDNLDPDRKYRFGEKEHEQAKKDGHYDKDYYKKRQDELNSQAQAFKDAKNNKTKVNPDNTIQNKNSLDKARDTLNYAQAKKSQLDNKIANAKNKAYMMSHPEEMLKEKIHDYGDKIKDKIKDKLHIPKRNLKEVLKDTAKYVGKSILKFLFTNPIGLILLFSSLFFIFIIFSNFMFFGDDSKSDNRIGLYGYKYFESDEYHTCTDVVKNGEPMSLDDYIQRVLSAEVGNFSLESQKALAIAARSYAVATGEYHEREDGSCYYDTSSVAQAFEENPERVNDINRQAVEETRGLIITVDNVPRGNYDASCVYTAADAQALDNTGNYTSDHYYIRFGSWTIGGIHFQEVDKDKINIGSLAIYANRAETDGPCPGNHGGGLSQNGALYLETYENYTWEEILDYYYDGKGEIQSLYHTYEITNNWTEVIDTTAVSSVPTVLLTTPINELMSENEYNDLNELIFDSVKAAGIGTRDAIVAAAVTPIKYLAENYGVTIPYTYGGGHNNYVPTVATGKNIDSSTSSYFGINPLWGTHVNANVDGKHSDYFGPDCSSWVPWVYTNAGIYLYPRKSYTFKDVVDSSDNHAMDGSFIAAPGDLLVSSGHVTVVVGVDTSTSNYYIAHARSQSVGVNITKVSFTAGTYTIVDMTKYIESHQMENYEEAFMNGVLSFK